MSFQHERIVTKGDLTKEELEAKAFIETVLLSSIHQRMSMSNPMLYASYNGRCCRQVAYIISLYLNEVLTDYEWRAIESQFDEGEGWEDEPELYGHAWVYGEHRTGERPNIIMDYGKLEHEYAFFLQTTSPCYPKRLSVDEDEEIWLDEEDSDYRKDIPPVEKESFTQLSFERIYEEIKQQLRI